MNRANLNAGWACPTNSRKAHYFTQDNLVSLCGKWWFNGEREDTHHDSPDNCAACNRRRNSGLGEPQP